MKAIWEGVILAESDETVVVEGNHYFPPESVYMKLFAKSEHITACAWKGIASYFHIELDKKINMNAAWCYPNPKDAAKEIKDYMAFWRGVEIIK